MDLSIRAVLEADTEIKDDRHYVFKPTEDEYKNGLLHVCYSCAKDSYIRRSSNDEESGSWLDSSYSCTNMFRKLEHDWGMTYLARDSVRSPAGGELSWRFDVNGMNKVMSRLELKAPSKLYEDGQVIWTIATDMRNFVQTSRSLQGFVTYELEGASWLSITAFLTGGRGECLYQHAQLFRQELSDNHNYPFEIKLFLDAPECQKSKKSDTKETETSSKSMNSSSDDDEIEIKTGYVFTPTEEEIAGNIMIITFDVSKDRYTHQSQWSPVTSELELPNWLDGTYSSTNVVREFDEEEGDAYLTLEEGARFGKVSWKFDVSAFASHTKWLRLKAPHTGSVIWVICCGKQCYMEEDEDVMNDSRCRIFALDGSPEVTITAFLRADQGNEALLFGPNGRDFYIELERGDFPDPFLGPEPVEGIVTQTKEEKELAEAEKMVDILLSATQENDVDAGYAFKPTEMEVENKMMYVCYSTKNDAYLRNPSWASSSTSSSCGSSGSEGVVPSWRNGTRSCRNIFRKENNYKWLTSLVREDGDKPGEVTWYFDVRDTELKIYMVDIQAFASVHETGSVLWTLSSGKQCYRSASLQDRQIFTFVNAGDLTITARLYGGQGSNAWEHSQLFPQSQDDDDEGYFNSFPFAVRICFGSPTTMSFVDGGDIDATRWKNPQVGSFGLPAEACAKVENGFVFTPTKAECADRVMQVRYNCSSGFYEYYSRKPSWKEKTTGSWVDHTFSATNMYRKYEFDHYKMYLARMEGTQFAEVTWKFDVSATVLKMAKLELTAVTALYEDAAVLWTIRAGGKTFIRTADDFKTLSSKQTFCDLDGARTMTISAFLTGGTGLVAWQHSQIFRQEMYDDQDVYPFQVKLFLESTEEETIESEEPPMSEEPPTSIDVDDLSTAANNVGLPAGICKQSDAHFIFKPTVNETICKLMHVSYNSSRDEYDRGAPLGTETISCWENCCYSGTNMFHMRELDHQMAYLSRMAGTQFAEVTWKFDVTDTDLCMTLLQLKAYTQRFEDGCVVWTIQADKKKFIQTAESLDERMVFELDGATTLTISALLLGGRGSEAWQHAQLFRQPLDDLGNFPFEIKLHLDSKDNRISSHSGGASRTIKAAETLDHHESGHRYDLSLSDQKDVCYTNYVFRPSEEEKVAQCMHVNYDAYKDVYRRTSCKEHDDNDERFTWKQCVHSSFNMTHVDDREQGVAYLARKIGSDSAGITWKFDVSGTDLVMDYVELMAYSYINDWGTVASIDWTISADSDKLIFKETYGALSTSEFKRYELHQSKVLTMTVVVKGPKGMDDENEAQLFHCNDASVYPFQVKLQLRKGN